MSEGETTVDVSKAVKLEPPTASTPRPTEGLVKLEESKRQEALNAMEMIAQRSIALHLHSMGISFTQEALEQMLELMEIHLDTMLSDLQKVTQTQRRAKASPKDLRLLLKDYDMKTSALEDEFLRTRSLKPDVIEKKVVLENMAEKAKQDELKSDVDVDPQNPSFVFFAQDEAIIRLVPPTNKGPDAMLPWMPQLPPDHTYRRTSKYLERITDQKIVREKVFEESKLGEKALDNLAKAIHHEEEIFEDKISDTEESAEPVVEEEMPVMTAEKYDIFSSNQKNFNIVRYARARLEFNERRQRKKEQKRKKNKTFDAELAGIVTNLSSYGKEEVKDVPSPDAFLEKQFQKTLHTFKKLKQQKLEREDKRKLLQEEAKRKREEDLKNKKDEFDEFDNFGDFEKFENFDTFGSNNAAEIPTFSDDGKKDDDFDVELPDAQVMESVEVQTPVIAEASAHDLPTQQLEPFESTPNAAASQEHDDEDMFDDIL